MTEPSHAVFLSYASQDASAAQRICEALRAAGIEVWFDRSELRGGDAWDQMIRRQIKTCALFIPVISKNTHARDEGYFRLEWKLAVDRCHLMAADRTFLLPVVIDDTHDDDERVPERFRDVQWTRLRGGETPFAFVERVRRLLAPEVATTHAPGVSAMTHAPQSPAAYVSQPSAAHAPGLPAATYVSEPSTTYAPVHTVTSASASTGKANRGSWWAKGALLMAVALIAATAVYFVVDRLSSSSHAVTSPPATAVATGGFSPPAHSIAVLPFVNMSEDKEQEYFSDGLTEELLNSLASIADLQVAARTSAFSFKGKDTDIQAIARKLNVGAILEGSVRRSGHTVRITAQLINAVTGFHLWSKTYDRDLGDVLKLQTEIATAVADSLKVTLLGDVSAKIEVGGTRNPAALDAYLRGLKAFQSRHASGQEIAPAVDAYTEAIRLDPEYALAFASRSAALASFAGEGAKGAEVRESFVKAEADARRAIALAPELAQGHAALAYALETGSLDFVQAHAEYERAVALAPGNAEVLDGSSGFVSTMGNFDAAIAAARRAVVLDPLARVSHTTLGRALYTAGHYEEAVAAIAESIRLDPGYKPAYGWTGFAYYALGDLQRARAACETHRDHWLLQQCLAVVYEKLGRHSDAQAELTRLKTEQGDDAAYQYATIYAQWGDRAQALGWLDTAMRIRDPGLAFVKTDPLLDPLRNEPRFQKIERELRFPQ